MSIQILEPIQIQLTENFIDENYPSINFQFEATAKQFSSIIDCKGEIYIEYSIFDEFIFQLKKKENNAILTDMNKQFNLEIIFLQNRFKFLWEFSKKSIDGSNIKIEFSNIISEEVFLMIRNQFIEYPKWW